MKKVIVSLVLFLLLTACDNQSERTEIKAPDISPEQITEEPLESEKPELTIADLGPAFSMDNYNPDEMIQISYEKELPENVEVVFSSEDATVLRFSATSLPGRSYVGMRVVDIYAGVDSGKILYKYITTGDGEHWLYGFMNDDFSLLTEGIYDRAFPFKDGNAIVKTSEGYGVINTEGNYVLPCSQKFVPELFQDIIKVPQSAVGESKEYFCFNRKTGEYIYTLKKTEDIAAVRTRFFKVSVDGTEEEIFDLSGLEYDGLILFKDEDNRRWGFKDGFGEVKIKPQYLRAYAFSDSYARVKMEEKFGYIDEYGSLVIPYIYDSAGDFKDGAAIVKLDGDEMLIDKNGNTLLNYDFKVLMNYSDGLGAAVLPGESKWQYVDENGELAFPNKFTSATSFFNGFALVRGPVLVEGTTANNFYYINTKGMPAFGNLLFYQATKLNEDGYALAWHTGGHNANDGSGEVKTAFVYYVIKSKIGLH